MWNSPGSSERSRAEVSWGATVISEVRDVRESVARRSRAHEAPGKVYRAAVLQKHGLGRVPRGDYARLRGWRLFRCRGKSPLRRSALARTLSDQRRGNEGADERRGNKNPPVPANSDR